jgi:DNA adenine methylase
VSNQDDDLLAALMGIHHDTHEEKPERTDIQRAPFGYVGGKSKSIKYLNKHLPYRQKWIDHFCGSCVVTLNRQESPLEVINDRYGGLVAFYRCLQNKLKISQLIERLEIVPAMSREEFYHCRDTWCTETDDVERAAKWFYMVRVSMLGKGKAFGRQVNPPVSISLPKSLELFLPIHHRLRNVIIENLDFRTCHKDFDGPSTVHYFDPPYINTDPGIFEGSTWTRDDLADLLRICERSQGFVALSGYPDEQIDACPFWTARHTWEVSIMADPSAFSEENSKAQFKDIKSTKDKATEVLWIKN